MSFTKNPHPEEPQCVVSKDAPKQIRRPYVLADLLKGMIPEAMGDAFDWGPDLGREIVD